MIDRLNIQHVQEFLRRYSVLEAEGALIAGHKKDLRNEMKQRGVPVHVINAAITIVKARLAVDASPEVLDECIAQVEQTLEVPEAKRDKKNVGF